MTTQATGRPATLQRDRLSVSTQGGLSTTINNPDPIDTYDYQDHGPSNTPSKKRGEKAKHPASPQGSQESGGDPDDLLAPEEISKRLEIYEKETKGRRARPPDNGNDIGEFLAIPNGSKTSSIISSASSRRRRWRRNNSVIRTSASRPEDKTRLRGVMLDWSTTQTDNTQRYILNATVTPPNTKVESQNSVIWQHSDFEDIKLQELDTLVAQLRLCGLRDSDIGLTRRLLKRVRLVSEREFVGGRFLSPRAFRYDMLDESRYGVDKCCIFLSFPYFAVQKPRESVRFKKGDERHPARTLLQSRYRLNETSEKDEAQCIRMLDTDSLKSCIKNPFDAETSHLTGKTNDELIYVPQLWALIIGLDHLVTAAPINDQALQGHAISITDDAVPNNSPRRVFVRISFMNHGMLDEVTYPLDQCTSWFGLLNKHQQIRNALRQGKEKVAPKHYPLQIGQHVLDDRTWASVQRSADGEVLKIWMETPRPIKPKVTVKKADGDSGSEERKASGSDDESLIGVRSVSSMTSANFKRLDDVPVTKAFLAWRVVDDFGETDDCPVNIQTRRFLNAIYDSLPATCTEANVNREARAAADRPSPRIGRSARPKIHIVGRVRKEVDDLGYHRSIGKSEPPIEQRLWWESMKLYKYFISTEESHHDFAPIKLFWGALYELMKDHPPCLNELLHQFKEINSLAERLHLGVHVQHTKHATGRLDVYKDDISESAILLASMVDALGAVYNLLVETVRFARYEHGSSTYQKLPSGKRATGYCNEACRLLEVARGQLITEATGVAPGENVGPVVTPETILIMIMERLVRGVFGRGTIDVINILEECLEQLALRVEKHSSRRLLQKLNAFEEEVDVVDDVLVQQTTVILAFRVSLDPAEFKKPTTARKMRFQFERQGIERILTHIKEQRRHCRELRERAKVLAVQNVQLVETLADDNGRAIFVFTFITVLFLPLSFVAGFFGMNLAGISDTKSKVSHFWYIAVPLTVSILVLCAVFVAWGESIWFAAADVPRYSRELVFGKEKKKRA